MKWEIELRYENGCGPVKLSGIGFRQAIYGGYDTKEEALEAFCRGQVALAQLKKENEKKEEEKQLEGFLNKVEGRMKDLRTGMEPQVQEEESEDDCQEGLKSCLVPQSRKQQYGDGFLPPEGYTNGKEMKIMERLDNIEQRLDVIDDYLTTIGSPDWGLRKQVGRIEQRIDSINGYLTDCYLPPNYENLRGKIEKLEKEIFGGAGFEGLTSMVSDLRTYKVCEIESRKALENCVAEIKDKISTTETRSIEGATTTRKYVDGEKKVFCMSCLGLIQREDRFCPHCGRRIIEEKVE